MDLLFRLFVVGFAIGVCGLACAYGTKQAVQDTVRKIVTPVLQDNERLRKNLDWANTKMRRKDIELEKLYREQRQAHFEANAENVLIKEKNPLSSN